MKLGYHRLEDGTQIPYFGTCAEEKGKCRLHDCHSPEEKAELTFLAEKTKEWKEEALKQKAEGKDMFKVILGTTPTPSSWEERFDEEYGVLTYAEETTIAEIKSFIKEVEREAYERGWAHASECADRNLFSHRNRYCKCFKGRASRE